MRQYSKGLLWIPVLTELLWSCCMFVCSCGINALTCRGRSVWPQCVSFLLLYFKTTSLYMLCPNSLIHFVLVLMITLIAQVYVYVTMQHTVCTRLCLYLYMHTIHAEVCMKHTYCLMFQPYCVCVCVYAYTFFTCICIIFLCIRGIKENCYWQLQ